MKKHVFRLLIVFLLVALVSVGILLSVSADDPAPTPTNTKVSSPANTTFYAPYNNGGSPKYDPQGLNGYTNCNKIDYSTNTAFYEFDVLISDNMLGFTTQLRSSAANVKVSRFSIGANKVATIGSASSTLQNGWHHVTVSVKQTHTVSGANVTYLQTWSAWIDGVLLGSVDAGVAVNGANSNRLYNVAADGVTITRPSADVYFYNYCSASAGQQRFVLFANGYSSYGNAPRTTVAPITYVLGEGASFARNASYTNSYTSYIFDVSTASHFYQVSTLTGTTSDPTASATLPEAADLTRLGYAFNGWCTDPGCTTPYAASDLDGEALTLYAGWNATGSSVVYNLDGGTNGDNSTSTLFEWDDAAQVITLPTPTKANFVFDGWYTDSDFSGDVYAAGADFTIAGGTRTDIQLYAKWTQTHGAVILHQGTGTSTPGSTNYPLNTASVLTLPSAVTKTGYTFLGWYDNADFTGTKYAAGADYSITAAQAVAEGISFWAKMVKDTVIDASDAAQTASLVDAIGNKTDKPSFGYADGMGFYTFNKTQTGTDPYISLGLGGSETGFFTVEFTVWGDGTGRFLPITLRFNGNGGYQTRKETYFFHLNADGTMRVGTGENTRVIGKVTGASYETASQVTLLLDLRVAGTMTVNAFVDGKLAVKDFSYGANSRTNADAVLASNADKVWNAYWYVSSNSTGAVNIGDLYIAEGFNAEDKEFNTKLMTAVTGAAIHYNTDGGTLPAGALTGTTAGSAYTLPTPTKEGSRFDGWYTNADFEGDPITEIPADNTDPVTVYAKFTALFTATFSVNGVTTPMADQTVVTMPESAPYWVAPDKTVLAAGASYTMTADGTFYALTVELLNGASVRVDTPTGLRFESTADAALIDLLKTIEGATFEVGTLILPTDKLVGNFTAEALTAAGITYLDMSSSLSTAVAANGLYTYFASITNILSENYTRAFSAISYISLTIGEDTYVVYSDYAAENNSRSIYDVAYAAFNDRTAEADEAHTVAIGETFSPFTEEQLTVIRGFIDRVAVLAISESTLVIANNSAYYTSPYTVQYEAGALTITGTGAENIATVKIGETAYTGGWTTESGTLSANYTIS